jgi:hypothetical protein
MYLSSKASRIRLAEAEAARRNRLEIVKALSHGDISRRDLFRWGLLTAGGLLASKNGLSPFATSAFAAVPTGTPRSPLFGAKKFHTRMPRAVVQKPIPLLRQPNGDAAWAGYGNEPPAKNWSYHNDYSNSGGSAYRNPVTGIGPMEGRPPGEFFAHQRWDELYPKVGYCMSLGQIEPHSRYCDEMPEQAANSV